MCKGEFARGFVGQLLRVGVAALQTSTLERIQISGWYSILWELLSYFPVLTSTVVSRRYLALLF